MQSNPGNELRPSRCRRLWLVTAVAVISGCASYTPGSSENARFRERAVDMQRSGLAVQVAVLDAEESLEVFGVPTYEHHIQPVWVSVRNDTPHAYMLNYSRLDRHYFSPHEAAYLNRYTASDWIPEVGFLKVLFFPLLIPGYVQATFAHDENAAIAETFDALEFPDLILPGETGEGFVYTNRLQAATRQLDVALLGSQGTEVFRFFVPVPGIRADHQALSPETPFADEAIRHFRAGEEAAFRTALEALPCCTTNEEDTLNREGTANGDPLNLVFVGGTAEILHSFRHAGWDETESLYFGSAVRTASAFLFESEYRVSPMSKLHLFGRGQDIGFQKIRRTIDDRHHFRLWRAPMTWDGRPVWLGASTRDIGVKFTTRAWNLMTHEIGPEVDDARDFVLETLLNEDRVARIGLVGGVGETGWDEPRENSLGSIWVTDGDRLVAFLEERPAGLEFIIWPQPDAGMATD